MGDLPAVWIVDLVTHCCVSVIFLALRSLARGGRRRAIVFYTGGSRGFEWGISSQGLFPEVTRRAGERAGKDDVTDARCIRPEFTFTQINNHG